MPTNQVANANLSTPHTPRNSRVKLVVLIGFCLIFVVSYAGRLAKKAQLETEAERWTARIEQANQQRLVLAAERDYVASNAYVQKTARDELGLAQVGDSIVLLVSITPTPAAPLVAPQHSAIKSSSAENWRQWLAIFVPEPSPAAR